MYKNNMADDEDDIPQLSAETFAALQEFYVEQEEKEQLLTRLSLDNNLTEDIVFDEDWQLSQFWYDEATIQSLVKVVDKITKDGGNVALVSCPTLFVPVKRILGGRASVSLFEYDRRFQMHGTDFIFYDYNKVEELPPNTKEVFDLVIADPPFISKDCIEKTSHAIRLLGKDKIIVCTGAVLKDQVEALLGLKSCIFKPQHKNNLANEFSCYSNFDLDSLLSSSSS